MLFCGRTKVQYPAPVILDGKELPWVEQADHLGHVLHQSVTMEKDCQRGRARFIDKTVDIREQFHFAHPSQVVQMAQVLCCDGYGSMIWDLSSNSSEQYFKSWNTFVKLAWRVPSSTFTYLVEGYFAAGQTSLRNQPGYLLKICYSPQVKRLEF